MSERVLIASLNWGLGHASRDIPLIDYELRCGNEVVLASDGLALQLLRNHYPDLEWCELPGYDIRYSRHMVWSMIRQYSKLIKAIKEEHKMTKMLVRKNSIQRIISDNRYGVFHKDVHSILVTHQLKLVSANPWINAIANRKLAYWRQPFDEIWVPDEDDTNKLTGKMTDISDSRILFIGHLSRFVSCNTREQYPFSVILSGPEPSRSNFERKIIQQVKRINRNDIFIVRGGKDLQHVEWPDNVIVKSMANAEELNQIICASEFVVARCGYSTIMDLIKLQKRALLIPTPGQPEQEYLAQRLSCHPLFTISEEKNLDISKMIRRQ